MFADGFDFVFIKQMRFFAYISMTMKISFYYSIYRHTIRMPRSSGIDSELSMRLRFVVVLCRLVKDVADGGFLGLNLGAFVSVA